MVHLSTEARSGHHTRMTQDGCKRTKAPLTGHQKLRIHHDQLQFFLWPLSLKTLTWAPTGYKSTLFFCQESCSRPAPGQEHLHLLPSLEVADGKHSAVASKRKGTLNKKQTISSLCCALFTARKLPRFLLPHPISFFKLFHFSCQSPQPKLKLNRILKLRNKKKAGRVRVLILFAANNGIKNSKQLQIEIM